MQILARGQRIDLSDLGILTGCFTLKLACQADKHNLDIACFGLDARHQLSDERYMTFFNQPSTPCQGVRLTAADAFTFDLQRLPPSIEALTLTLALDHPDPKLTLNTLGHSSLQLLAPDGRQLASLPFDGTWFIQERAIMLVEIYRKNQQWRLKLVAQGFNGGLAALVSHFGGVVAAPPAVEPPPATRVSLEKRIEKEAPQLVSLVKKAAVSLEKAGLSNHRARVCLCLDISGSMSQLYASGAIQRFAERILALACRFDDDGEIDVFLFGQDVHHPKPMTLANCSQYIPLLLRHFPLEGDTRYGRAMKAITEFYLGTVPQLSDQAVYAQATPIYVMFVTDGGTSDKSQTESLLRATSHAPIFWQYMGIGKGRKSKSKKLARFIDSDFPFLENLDELSGRLIDNANFFSVLTPEEYSDEALYSLLMEEYPHWLKLAQAHHMLP